jgi:hypothetical protein
MMQKYLWRMIPKETEWRFLAWLNMSCKRSSEILIWTEPLDAFRGESPKYIEQPAHKNICTNFLLQELPQFIPKDPETRTHVRQSSEVKSPDFFYAQCFSLDLSGCQDGDLNPGHEDFQSSALPTELSRLTVFSA